MTISKGVITHPNLVRSHGNVAANGAVRASVTVHDKHAAGVGRLQPTRGAGSWSGYSGSARCSGVTEDLMDKGNKSGLRDANLINHLSVEWQTAAQVQRLSGGKRWRSQKRWIVFGRWGKSIERRWTSCRSEPKRRRRETAP
ncbi:hypothetical protein [Bradyrhizobium stylosanthis]|uniref:hypothetical protein n=1 Tax=Bradyrhizobium stylosanthis TaxID=1803665 RepID=UPI00119CDFFE|nr:hypothetical protein [Bradyrhizobium stylosanthis]